MNRQDQADYGSQRALSYGRQKSAIRQLFEYGKTKAQEIGAEKVFDFSIGNPSVPPPREVDLAFQALLKNEDPMALHGYTSASGDPAVRVAGQEHLSAVGRMTEDVVLGNDTLSRTLHDVIPRWASRVIGGPGQVHGIPPLTARTEEWAD